MAMMSGSSPPPPAVQHVRLVPSELSDPNAPKEGEHLVITRAELERAKAIKNAVEEDERIIEPPSDYDVVQWALTTEELSLADVCERIYLIQCFRQEYNLHDTWADGMDLICNYCLKNHPGLWIKFDYLGPHQCYCTVEDIAKFYPGNIQTKEDYRTWLGANYYWFHAANANFTAIRNGHTLIIECMDTTFEDNYDATVINRCIQELFIHYPKIDRNYHFVNSPTIVSFFWGLMKRFVPEHRRPAWRLGERNLFPGLEGVRLDTLFNVPTLEAARNRMVYRMCEALDLRYKNRNRFSLSNCQVID